MSDSTNESDAEIALIGQCAESSVRNDSEAPSTSFTPKKKQKLAYDQKYKESWEKEMKWVLKSKKGLTFAW